MRNHYNIYDMMLRAAAGEGAAGAEDDDASDTANAKTINAGDEDDDGGKQELDDANNDAAAAEGKDGAKGSEDAEVDPAAKPVQVVPRDVMLRRVRELTTDKRTQAEKIAALEAENARLAAAKPAEGEADPPAREDFKTETEFRAAVRAETLKLKREEEFTNKCNAVADAGEKDFKATWNDSMANLKMLSDDGQIPWTILNAALEADNPAQALHELGKNPEEAQRILQLSPIQQVAQVVKHGMKAAPARTLMPRSQAADPVDPIGGAGGVNENTGLGDDVDDATWMRNRQAQLAAGRR